MSKKQNSPGKYNPKKKFELGELNWQDEKYLGTGPKKTPTKSLQ